MEGKAVLFKKFAGIDCFDIEINERDPDKLVDIIAALEPTFGGINLEDIKAPECFYIERKLRERMKIPVFHDDQHGTAIIVGAAVLNGLKVVGKDIGKVKLVCSGAGAAALACLDLLVRLGLPAREHLRHRHQGRGVQGPQGGDGRPQGALRASRRKARTLAEIIAGRRHLPRPVRRRRAEARDGGEDGRQAADPRARQSRARDHAGGGQGGAARRVIATGRSDYPNQVNNVLCFPFIFRGALDVGATTITEAMKLAARARDRRARAGRAVGHRGARLRHREPALRPGVPDPEAVRSAPDREDRAGGGQGGDGLRRGDAADRRPRRLPRAADAVRLPLRPDHEAGVRGGEEGRRSASCTPKARTSACCARCRSWWTRASRGRS